ncbi:regulator of chromosome condensation (RCC1) [Roseburia intestinalis L1-82]|uniref:Regulator of chromosome condensation (RCC1) n=1 Tax=Roseburia intestinalis L1-82 TaxID=536231 RepID=C7GGT2_9FIRM|nr:fibronectin type III domain-containing protein [Roseburia intestinalis]EEU98948.1 regulator of chromosome condensation (RCC1) [Roseburia intestinalis L1-82]
MTETEETVEIKETETEEQTEELQETEKTDARVTSELTVRGTDSFGSMFAQEFSGVAAEQTENNGCNVFSIDMSGNQASVSFETTQDATLVVAVYDENGNQMLASGKKNVTNTETETTVTINSGTIPQYYLVRGYLIETETLRPICTVYESSMYTQEMQEFLAKTTDDFDEEKVLNLDDDDTNNFAVYGDDTIIIPSETGKNIVVSADDSTNTYVIKNADTDMTSLEEGDIFSYEYADGQFIITKVASIDVNGTTVTITGDDIEMEDVFSYVKIDASDDLANATIDPSACGDGVTYEGLSDEPENSEYKAADISGSVKKTMKFRLDKSGKDSDGSYSISGGLWMRITYSAKLYLTFSKCYVELKLDYKGSLDITAKGKFTATVPLPSVGYMFYGIIVELTPSMIYEWEINGAVGADISGTFGIQADNNGITSLTTMPKCTPKLKISGSFYWGLSLEPRVKILSNNVASASLTGKAGIKLNASWKPEILKQEKTIHSCQKCIEGKINAELTLKAGVKMLSKISYNINLIGESKKIADFYYSIDHNDYGLTKCPHLSYRLNLVVVDTDGNLLPDTVVTITDQTGQFEEVKKKTDMLGKLSVYLPESRYTITPVKDGYVPTRRNIEIHMDETIDDLRITLCKTVGGWTGNKIDTVRPDLGLNSYSQVLSSGVNYMGVISGNGSLYMWGNNDCGQLGDGTKTYRDIPVKIMDNVVSVSVGRYASGAITKDRSLYMWGYNAWGQLGNGTIVDEVIPVKVLDDVVAVGTNGATSAAITSNGDLYMWGVDIYGYEPTKIMSNVRDIKFGDDCYGIIKEDGSLYMWGCNDYGQLGDGTTEGRYVPDVPVKIMDNVRNVIMGEYNINGAITNNGELYLWGTGHLEPVRIMDNVLAASISMTLYLNSGVLTKDGRLYEWDDNDMMAFGAPTVEITIPGGVALPSAISTQSEESSSDSVPVLTAAPDSTQQASESEPVDQPEALEEEAVSVFKADATETNTATGTQTASFKNLTPNDTYNFYVARSLTADDLLASDNILDIRQAVAGEDGRMSVTYQPRETDDNAVIFVVGSTPKDLSGAQITIGNTTYNGTAKSVTAAVECDGKTLVEGRDYLVTGGFEITGLGTYTLTIIGTGIYTGTASKTYTVTCQHNYTESITKQPTCTEPGRKTLTCSICGAVKDTTSIPKTAHTYKNKKVTKRATTSKNGTFTAVCSVCGAEQTEVIYAAKTIKLSKTSMTYNGKKQKPSVTITDAAGKRLKNGTDYKVTYPKKTQNVGKYTVTVTLKGNYTGTVKKTFTILPKNTAISKLTASKNTVTVKWKKQTKQTAGYEIQYSTSSKFTKKTTKTVKAAKNSMTSKKITKLKAKKKYYVRIRTYQTVKVGKKSTKIYASWSKAKTVTTKKS